MTQSSSRYSLRARKNVNYADVDLIDDYRKLGTFAINDSSFIIKQNSKCGLLTAKQASFPYFYNETGIESCWIRFYPQERNDLYFEKQLYEVGKIEGCLKYFEWIESKYNSLLPTYKNKIKYCLSRCQIIQKYHIGDICVNAKPVQYALRLTNTDFIFVEVTGIRRENHTTYYIVRYLDISNHTLSTLSYFYDVFCPGNVLKLVLSVNDKNVMNNDELIIQTLLHKQYKYERDIYKQKYQATAAICDEMCENALNELNVEWSTWMTTSFVHQHKKIHTPMTTNLFEQFGKAYYNKEYNVRHWKRCRNKIKSQILSQSVAKNILSEDATKQSIDIDHSIVIAEPQIIHDPQESQLIFTAHICKLNERTGVLDGDPVKKRERKRKKKMQKKLNKEDKNN